MPPATAAAKSDMLQSCLTLCYPIDGSPSGSPVPGILQARTLEGVAISFSNLWKWKVKVKSLSRVWLLATLWTAAYQVPPSMGFSGQEYWSGVPLPSPKCLLEIYISDTYLNEATFFLTVFLYSSVYVLNIVIFFQGRFFLEHCSQWNEGPGKPFTAIDPIHPG